MQYQPDTMLVELVVCYTNLQVHGLSVQTDTENILLSTTIELNQEALSHAHTQRQIDVCLASRGNVVCFHDFRISNR